MHEFPVTGLTTATRPELGLQQGDVRRVVLTIPTQHVNLRKQCLLVLDQCGAQFCVSALLPPPLFAFTPPREHLSALRRKFLLQPLFGW